jgi:hypothetical protein
MLRSSNDDDACSYYTTSWATSGCVRRCMHVWLVSGDGVVARWSSWVGWTMSRWRWVSWCLVRASFAADREAAARPASMAACMHLEIDLLGQPHRNYWPLVPHADAPLSHSPSHPTTCCSDPTTTVPLMISSVMIWKYIWSYSYRNRRKSGSDYRRVNQQRPRCKHSVLDWAK